MSTPTVAIRTLPQTQQLIPPHVPCPAAVRKANTAALQQGQRYEAAQRDLNAAREEIRVAESADRAADIAARAKGAELPASRAADDARAAVQVAERAVAAEQALYVEAVVALTVAIHTHHEAWIKDLRARAAKIVPEIEAHADAMASAMFELETLQAMLPNIEAFATPTRDAWLGNHLGQMDDSRYARLWARAKQRIADRWNGTTKDTDGSLFLLAEFLYNARKRHEAVLDVPGQTDARPALDERAV